jgi:acyl carrier protein
MPEITLEDLLKLVSLQLGKRNPEADDHLVEDLGAESVDLMNIVAAVEAKYGVVIKESEIARVTTTRELLALVLEKKVEK